MKQLVELFLYGYPGRLIGVIFNNFINISNIFIKLKEGSTNPFIVLTYFICFRCHEYNTVSNNNYNAFENHMHLRKLSA